MPELSQIGKGLLLIGIILAVVGVLLMVSDKIPWLGRLPGDFAFKGKNFSAYFPLGTSLLISIVLSLIFWLIHRR